MHAVEFETDIQGDTIQILKGLNNPSFLAMYICWKSRSTRGFRF
jgi:hypothetical protein